MATTRPTKPPLLLDCGFLNCSLSTAVVAVAVAADAAAASTTNEALTYLVPYHLILSRKRQVFG